MGLLAQKKESTRASCVSAGAVEYTCRWRATISGVGGGPFSTLVEILGSAVPEYWLGSSDKTHLPNRVRKLAKAAPVTAVVPRNISGPSAGILSTGFSCSPVGGVGGDSCQQHSF